jgi:hypothetical protein
MVQIKFLVLFILAAVIAPAFALPTSGDNIRHGQVSVYKPVVNLPAQAMSGVMGIWPENGVDT